MVKYGCIYRLTNTKSGKKYIGKTVNFKKRMYCHKRSNTKRYLSNAIRKYGWDTFKKEIIVDNIVEEDLNMLEISYIQYENTMAPNGYNLTRGGEGCSGYIMSDIDKKKMSQAQKKRRARREQFGSISRREDRGKYIVRSAWPEQRTIGWYLDKKKALEALKYYNETGEYMESDAMRYRKPGSGSIFKNRGRYKARVTVNGKRKEKNLNSVEECEAWISKIKEQYNKKGVFTRERREPGSGCIVLTENQKYKAVLKRNGTCSIKTFQTKEECETWMKSIKT